MSLLWDISCVAQENMADSSSFVAQKYRGVSGGASGTDMGFINGCRYMGVEVKGSFVSKNYPVEIAEKFGLLVDSKRGHETKDQMNVDQSDVLIVHRAVGLSGANGRGASQTRNYALFGDYVYHEEKVGDKVFGDDKYKINVPVENDKVRNGVNGVVIHYSGESTKKKMVIEIWGVNEENKDMTENRTKEILDFIANEIKAYKDLRPPVLSSSSIPVEKQLVIMISGPTEETCKCEKMIEQFYISLFKYLEVLEKKDNDTGWVTCMYLLNRNRKARTDKVAEKLPNKQTSEQFLQSVKDHIDFMKNEPAESTKNSHSFAALTTD